MRNLATIKIIDYEGDIQTEMTSDKNITDNEIFIILLHIKDIEKQLIEILEGE